MIWYVYWVKFLVFIYVVVENVFWVIFCVINMIFIWDFIVIIFGMWLIMLKNYVDVIKYMMNCYFVLNVGLYFFYFDKFCRYVLFRFVVI